MRLVGVCLLAALVGCGSDPQITGVRIVVQYGSPPPFDQFEFRLDLDEGLSDPIVRPEKAGAPLPASQDLVVYVPDDWASKTATCRVQGRRAGAGVGRPVQHNVTVELHRVVPCAVTLELP